MDWRGALRTGGAIVRSLRAWIARRDPMPLVRHILQTYGEKGRMLRIDIDSENKTMEVEAHLKGQKDPFRIRAVGYRIVGDPGARRIVFDSLETPASWLEVALRTFKVAERGAPLPSEYEELIDLAL